MNIRNSTTLLASAVALALHADITDHLVLHLPLDADLKDASGRNNHGNAVGSVGFGAGQVGAGAARLSFAKDGTSFNFINLGAPPDLNFGTATDFSVSFWAKFSDWVFDPPFIGNKDWLSGQYQGWMVATGTDGRLQWNYGGAPGQRKDYDGPGGTMSDGSWHHVVVTFLRAGEVVTYLDGVPVDERDVSASANNVDTAPGLALNIGQDGTGRYTDGNSVQILDLTMDDVGIWRRVLTANEAKAVFLAGKAGQSLVTVASTPEVPVLVKQPVDQEAMAGGDITFRVLPRGTSPFAFQWLRNGQPIPGKTEAVLALSNVQAGDAGSYSCVVSNVAGSAASAVATLAVDASQPPAIISQPLASSVSPGGRATFAVKASGVLPLSYQWFLGNTPIQGATTDSYVVPRATASDVGDYRVEVRAGNGQTSTSAMVSLQLIDDVRQGLVAHLTFDSDFSDSSGRGNHGAAVGTPELVPGFLGPKALRFSQKADGSEFNYVTLGRAADLEFSTDADFTFSCWVKLSGWQRDPLFISNKNWSSGGNVGYALATGADGRFQWNYVEQVGERRDFDSVGGLIGDGRWHHVAVSFRRGGEAVTLVDGIEVNRQPIPTTGTTISPGFPTNIGQDGTGSYTDNGTVSIEGGFIDDVAIWRRALSAEELLSIHRKGLVGSNVQQRSIAEGLVAYLPFDGDLWDRSGRGNHGIPVGSPNFAQGKLGAAMAVTSLKDGTSFHYVTLGRPAGLQFGTNVDFTVSFWTRFTNWSGDPVLVGNKDWRSGGNQGWAVATAGNGRLQWNLGDGDAGGRTRKDYDGPGGTLGNGAWHHVTTVFRRASNAETYLDGVLVDTTSIVGGLDSLDTPEGLAVNIGQDGRGSYTDNGNVGTRSLLIDDVAVWSRALDGPEVAGIYGRGTAGLNLFGQSPASSTLPQGVAAGDATDSSVLLWTRSTANGPVRFDLGESPDFAPAPWVSTNVLASNGVPVKAVVAGLKPATRYHYKATDAAGSVAFGTFVTFAAPGSSAGVRFGVSGDARGDLGPFPSIANAPSRGLDLFVNLGDTIYADYASPSVPAAQARSLDEFRNKHAEVLSERLGVNPFAWLRSGTLMFATIDDHEVSNDFAGGAPGGSDPRFEGTGAYLNDSTLYRNGLQAFQEFNPILPETYPASAQPQMAGKPRLYRHRRAGRDAAFFILDARSFRDAELTAPSDPTNPIQVASFLARSFDVNPLTGAPLPRRTLLGRTQLDQLKADLVAAQQAGVTWKFVMVPEPIQNLGVLAASDRFEGYAAERTELLSHIRNQGIRDVVFISADIHGTLVNNLTYQLGPGQPQVPTTAFEYVTGPVAFDAPFGPTVLDLASQVPSVGGKTLLDDFLASLGLPNRAAFDAFLTPAQKNAAIRGLVDAQVTPLGYSPLGLEDSQVQARFVSGGPVQAFSYGWTEFEVLPASQDLRITTYGIAPHKVAGADTLLSSPAVVSELFLSPERPSLRITRDAGGAVVSWEASFDDYLLQESGSLTGAWSAVAASLVGPEFRAAIQDGGVNGRYFRLVKR